MTDDLRHVRYYLELAESCHPGSMRSYAAMIRAYANSLDGLVGRDELVCSVCGVENFDAEGRHQHGTFISFRDKSFCAAHHAEALQHTPGAAD